MKHRKIKSEIAFYLQNFDQIEYHEYVDRQTRDFCRKIEKESVNKQHTDYFLNYYVPKVKIYDILSNDGMTKLVNSLYKLSHQKYKVFNVLYRKPTILHKYDYVHMQKEHCFLGRLAEVQFIDSKYINCIDITVTQMNDIYAFIEYDISFSIMLNEENRNQFIIDYLPQITDDDYFESFNIDGCHKMEIIYEMNQNYFEYICQHFVTSLFFSETGTKRKLLSIVYQIRKESIDIDKIYLGDNLCISYYNKDQNIILNRNYDSTKYVLLSGDNEVPKFDISEYVMKYGNIFYLRIMGESELTFFEKEYSKYVSGRKKIYFNREIIKLFKQVRSFSECQPLRGSEQDLMKDFDKNWILYN
ncbi:MAG: hypothetical protein ACLSUA_10555 [Agathobacter rectalis]